MGNFFIAKIIRMLGKKFDGYKTTIGGIGLILTGLLGLLGYAFPDQPDLPKMDIETALTNIALGFTALGLGGKLEKTKTAVSENKQNEKTA
jgi:hypothetical protein